MDERVLRFRVGVVVLSAAFITVILVLIFGALPKITQRSYTVMIKFPAAPGVNVNTPVRKSGIPIGRVSNVELLDDGVRLTMRIDSQQKIRRREVCRIGIGSFVTGDAKLEFVPRADNDLGLISEFDSNQSGSLEEEERAAANEPLTDGEFLANGRVARDPFEVIIDAERQMKDAFLAIQAAGERVAILVDSANTVIGNNDDQIRRIMQKTETALDGFNVAINNVNTVIGDPDTQAQLKKTLDDLPALFTQASTTMQKAQSTLDGFQSASERLDRNLANLEQLTEPLAENGAELAENIRSSVANLDQLLQQLATFSEALNSGEGTIGRLLRDDELYVKLNAVIGNVEDLTRRMRPIVQDVRFFTDKIARDPGQLGARGLIDRGSGLKFGVPSYDSPGYFERRRQSDNLRSSRRE